MVPEAYKIWGTHFKNWQVRGPYALDWKTLGRCTVSFFPLVSREQETWVRSLGWEDPLEKGMATHSSMLPGEFRGQKSLAGYSPWRRTVGHDWATNTFIFTFKKRAEEIAVMNEEFSLGLWGGKKSCSTVPWSWFYCWRNSMADLREVLHLSLCLMGVLVNDIVPLHWVEPELLVSESPRPCGHAPNTCAYRDSHPHASAKMIE